MSSVALTHSIRHATRRAICQAAVGTQIRCESTSTPSNPSQSEALGSAIAKQQDRDYVKRLMLKVRKADTRLRRRRISFDAEAGDVPHGSTAISPERMVRQVDSIGAPFLDTQLPHFGRLDSDFERDAPPPKPGFLNMGVRPTASKLERQADDEYEGDDISSIAHRDLEQHREFRHYARIAAWEMPQLIDLAKPFVPPNADHFLRFRYTSYLGESHPAEKKVVVEFVPDDVPNLTPIQLLKLKKLVGPRYDPQKNIIKMSCESSTVPRENKEYLLGLVSKLVTEARDSTDDFADIPLDLRHHKWKKQIKFPLAWRYNTERKYELLEIRAEVEADAEQRQLNGLEVDGVERVQQALLNAPEPVAAAEMVMAGSGKGAKKLKGKRSPLR